VEADTSVVNVGEVGGGWEGVSAGGGMGGKGMVEVSQNFVEDKAGEEGAEGAALGETLILEEVCPGGIVGTVPTDIGRVV
jgi:hypothetical protein